MTAEMDRHLASTVTLPLRAGARVNFIDIKAVLQMRSLFAYMLCTFTEHSWQLPQLYTSSTACTHVISI